MQNEQQEPPNDMPIMILVIFIAFLLLVEVNFNHKKYHKICKPIIHLVSGILCNVVAVYLIVTKYEQIKIKYNK